MSVVELDSGGCGDGGGGDSVYDAGIENIRLASELQKASSMSTAELDFFQICRQIGPVFC